MEENPAIQEKVQLYDFKIEAEDDSGVSNTNDTDSDGVTKREEWGSGVDFILSLLGYAVGLGNLWRFPYLCVRNGGGAFLIPFLFFLVTCGLPLFFMEVSLGQFRGKGILHVWEICPLFKGIGVGMVITLAIISVYYNTIIAWTLYYIGNSFQAEVPWSRCDGWWSTSSCYRQGDSQETHHANITTGNTTGTNYSSVLTSPSIWKNNSSVLKGAQKPMTSTEEFWQYNVLRISSGLDDLGSPSWYMSVAMVAAWVLVFLCIFKGVKSIGKVVYVTALLPYLLLLIILIRGVTLPGAVDGIILFLKPDLERMMSVQVWVEAALQVFYSLGPGWGPLIAMASFCKFNENTLRTSIMITFLGEGTSIFSGFVVFTILGFMAHELGVPVEEVVKSGPGLGFVAYPQALARLPLPQFWSFLFFFMLMIVGLDSQFFGAVFASDGYPFKNIFDFTTGGDWNCVTKFAAVEAMITAVTDSFPTLQRRRVLVSAAVCAVMCVLGIPFICQGGIYSFQLVDWYVASFGVPLFCLLECIMIGWIYGAERFSNDIRLMIGRGVPIIIRFCWCFLSPLILLACLIFTIATYKPPTYGDYNYPVYGNALGWFISLIPVIPVIVVPLYQLYVNKKPGIIQKLKSTTQPSEKWGPHPGECDVCYDTVKFSYSEYDMKQRIKLNLTGHC